MSKDKVPPEYQLDDVTLEELAAVFTWAQMIVDAQLLDEAADEMQYIMQSLSDRLGLMWSDTELDVEEIIDEDGQPSFKVRMGVKTTPKPALVWTNDQPQKPGLKIVDKDYVEPLDEPYIAPLVNNITDITPGVNDNDDEPPKLA